MPSFSKTKILPHSAEKIYKLVMDIEKYPEFLPWCKNAKITKVISAENLQADLLISFKGFFEKYSSNVIHLQNDNYYKVNVCAISGPFKNLENSWKISAIDEENCEVDFFIEFEFSSIFLGKMIGMIFEKATEKMMDAFEERARGIGGNFPLE